MKEIILAPTVLGSKERVAESRLEWWSRGDADHYGVALQAKSFGAAWMEGCSLSDARRAVVHESNLSGPQRTLQVLHESRESAERQSAIIDAAVLFQLLGCSRPYWSVPAELKQAVEAYVGQVHRLAGFSANLPWQSVHTNVLPESAIPGSNYLSRDLSLPSLDALQARVKEVAARQRRNWVPVWLHATLSESKLELAKEAWRANPLTERYRESVLHSISEREALEARKALLDAQAKQEFEAKRAIFPRWGEWRELPDEELADLVWAKQLTALAAEFGVSDMAIRKRCDARVIERPPQGYWLRSGIRETS